MDKCLCVYLGMIDRRRARFQAEGARTGGMIEWKERSIAQRRGAQFEKDKATELVVTVGSPRPAVRSGEVNICSLIETNLVFTPISKGTSSFENKEGCHQDLSHRSHRSRQPLPIVPALSFPSTFAAHTAGPTQTFLAARETVAREG